ncbi:MAG: polyphenol oxidase family protein [Eubacteriales bacterium]|nr:polyphenol oxidase family protein [Eubacteriales bacterium]
MFYRDGILERSAMLSHASVAHGFSTRFGGVSTHPYTVSMNLAMGREDPDSVVRENMERFARAVTGGSLCGDSVVTASQIHSAKVRVVTSDNCGEGIYRAMGEPCDGFVTDVPGVMPVIRVADCVPILLCGEKKSGEPVIGAIHAGWRGSAAGIAAVAAERMVGLGAIRSTIRAAIGTHIGLSCYEVREDFVQAVGKTAGMAFGQRFCIPSGGRYYADLTGMNRYWLSEAGIDAAGIDVSPWCTMCAPGRYHSHRATNGRRGAMGAGIVIL